MSYNNDIDALKALYTKLGGDDDVTGINTSSDMIGKLVEVVDNGGGGESQPSTNDEIEITYTQMGSGGGILKDGWTVESIMSLIESGHRNIFFKVKSNADGVYQGYNVVLRYTGHSTVNGGTIYFLGYGYYEVGANNNKNGIYLWKGQINSTGIYFSVMDNSGIYDPS